jgi:hypothetical protein
MRQLLDFFALLSAAGGEPASLVDWQLVEVSMQSPLRATAEAYAKQPGIDAAPIALHEKAILAASITSLAESGTVPDWMDQPTLARAKALFGRNTNGIGHTNIQFDENAPIAFIDQRRARAALETISRHEQLISAEQDRSRTEMGSLEGNVLLTGPYYGQPAIQLRESLSDAEIWCVFTPETAASIGPNHSWAETWRNRRVRVTGAIQYDRKGNIRRVNVSTLKEIDPTPLHYSQIADPNFTGGLSASDYIKSLWEEDVG